MARADQRTGLWKGREAVKQRPDVTAPVEKLRSQPACNGRVATVGFCLGGKLALYAAIDGIGDAAVSFYPVQVTEYQDDLKTLTCPVQTHLGTEDQHTPQEVIDILRSATDQSPNEFYLHEGAGHGFYNSVRSFGYHPQAAADAHAAILRFLRAIIGPYS